jgi:hypothetical protein
MHQKSARYRLLRILLPLALFILGCPSPGPAYTPIVITVAGQVSHLVPGSTSTLLVQGWENATNQPAADAEVTITLSSGEALFSGRTDESGMILASFAVPEMVTPGEQVLSVQIRNEDESAAYDETIYVGRTYNVLVSSDKPVYQPGQIIHLRALALDALALAAAADQPLILSVDDPEGNRLLRQELTTSRWGIGAADFVLDSQATSGDYTLTASIGPISSSRTVEVKPYKLPRFKVEFGPDRTYYLPGDVAQGVVSANYFFGKPVAGGEVRIQGFVGGDRFSPVLELTGETDADGNFAYEFVVPESFIGQLGNESAEIDLEITVIDTAEHAETIDETVTVAEQPLLIEAVAESGQLRTDLENLVYLQVTSPDGSSIPAELTITVDGGTRTVQTDEFGLATITVSPVDALDVILDIEARALILDIPPVQTRLRLSTRFHDTSILLRPERAEVAVGETLNLDIFVAGEVETVYLDIAKAQQTFGLVALPVVDGMAQAELDIDGSLLGTLDLNAYTVNARGNIVRDRRFVLVNPGPAQVTVTTDQAVYRPGDSALLDVQVTRDGAPMTGALGISIVDESVFALGAQDPGFVRTFFLLDRELDEPWYEIRNFAPLADDDPSPYDSKRRPIRSNVDPVALNNARDVALFGFFAEELARSAPAPQPVETAAEDRLALILSWSARAGLALPLLGIGFYDGSRRRRHLLIGLVLLGLASFFWGACASASPAAAPAAEAPADDGFALQETSATRGQPEPPRLRQYFPETLFWAPEVETDADGRAQIPVPIADSITTWRISVVASDEDGTLGSAQTGLRVFQEFFVEPNLPRFLTVGDEISVPVSLFNYLDQPQTIDIAVEPAPWFEFIDSPTLTVDLEPAEVSSIYVPIRVIDFGDHTFTVTATGSARGLPQSDSDAVQREVEILPDGQARQAVVNGTLEAETQATVLVPEDAVAGASRVTVKIYPGVISQLLDGLSGMIREPYGCFEQTTSVNYPNVMVLDYLRATEQLSPRIERQAERFLDLGYQRLLTFETEIPGGFSFYGDPPPLTMLTAYGLMQLQDMSRVRYVDPDLLQRMAVYLLDLQNDDHWAADTLGYGVEASDFTTTAYITWALAEAGYDDTLPLRRAARYLTRVVETLDPLATDSQATPTPITLSPLATPEAMDAAPSPDLYSLALAANALLTIDPRDRDALDLLESLIPLAEQGEDGVFWPGEQTILGGYGRSAQIETSALMVLALQRSGQHPDLVEAALDSLVAQRHPFGGFGTTQSTVLVLKALINDAVANQNDGAATVTVVFNGGRTETVTIDDANAEVMQQFVFDDIASGEQIVDLIVDGDRNLQYQVVADYYLPWSLVETDGPERQQPMRIDVAYDRTELAVNETVVASALVELLAPGNTGTVLVETGVPPGLSPIAADLDALVEDGRIDRYEFTGRTLRFYLSGIANGFVYRYDYRLRAEFPVNALAPSSQVYEYYAPQSQDISPPQRIRVTLGTP